VKKITLIGGTHDGRQVIVCGWQKAFIIPRVISLAESDALHISGEMMWRHPEDVYELQGDGTFTYQRTIVYGPPEAVRRHQDERED
jgi:hypothetical protein